jgi:hypothetical protein
MHSRFIENHPIRILEDGPLISEGVLSHTPLVVQIILKTKFQLVTDSSYIPILL